MVVCKFGGSSVSEASQIDKVKNILLSNKERHIAVVSAPGKRFKEDIKITDMLYTLEKQKDNKEVFNDLFSKIEKRYIEIAQDLKIDSSPIVSELEVIKEDIENGKGPDYAASRGEYLSALIISKYLGWTFLDMTSLIIIEDDGSINGETYANLARVLNKKHNYVIPGFYGSSMKGSIKTFSRGGSDITGSIISKAANASLYENWTDVSGMYNADPRVVKNAKPVASLTYSQVRELSALGASVFHAEAIAPVIEAEIPINIKNTNSPSDPGTLISSKAKDSSLVGVTVKTGYSCMSVEKLMLFKKSKRETLLTILNLFGIRPEFGIQGVDTNNWYFDSSLASDEVLQDLCDRFTKEFELMAFYEKGKAILAVVGSEIVNTNTAIDSLLALREANIDIDFVNLGANETTLLIGLNEKDSNDALVAIYNKLF